MNLMMINTPVCTMSHLITHKLSFYLPLRLVAIIIWFWSRKQHNEYAGCGVVLILYMRFEKAKDSERLKGTISRKMYEKGKMYWISQG